MLIIIYPSKKNNLFLTGKNILNLDKICHLKSIKDKKNILIINCLYLNHNGLISDYNYFLEEVFISINITHVISTNTNDKLREICSFYKIELIEI